MGKNDLYHSYKQLFFVTEKSSGFSKDEAERWIPELLLKKLPLVASMLFMGVLIFAMFLRIKTHQPWAIGPEAYQFLKILKVLHLEGMSGAYLAVAPFLMVLLGGAATYLLAKLGEEMSLKKALLVMSLSFWIVSPNVIYVFTAVNRWGFMIFFQLLIVALLMKESTMICRKRMDLEKSIVFMLFLIMSYVDMIASLFYLIIMIIYWKYGPYKNRYAERLKEFIVKAFIILLASFIVQTAIKGVDFIDQLFPREGLLQTKSVYASLLSDFGGLYGFSIFFLILVGIGVFECWKWKRELPGMWITVPLMTLSYGYGDVRYSVPLTIVFCVLAGLAFNTLLRQQWKLGLIRNFSLLLFTLGCLFSVTAFIFRYPLLEPQSNFITALHTMEEKYGNEEQKGLLTYQGYKKYVEGLTSFSIVNSPEQGEEIFYARRLNTLLPLLDKYQIRYIMITPEMRNGLVWTDTVQLLFLLENSEKFKKKVTTSDLEIWEYTGTKIGTKKTKK